MQFVVNVPDSDPCTSTTITAPTLPPLIIDQSYMPTTIPAFGDTLSGSNNPPTCQARTCSSQINPNVIWDDASQQFTVQSLPSDVVATTTVTLTCSLTYYSSVPSVSSSFELTTALYQIPCVTGNGMIIPSLPTLTIDQYYTATTIPAFGDILSGTTNPPTCGPRTCSSDNTKVVWDDATQLFNVQTL